jgi:hypothetical protein
VKPKQEHLDRVHGFLTLLCEGDQQPQLLWEVPRKQVSQLIQCYQIGANAVLVILGRHGDFDTFPSDPRVAFADSVPAIKTFWS